MVRGVFLAAGVLAGACLPRAHAQTAEVPGRSSEIVSDVDTGELKLDIERFGVGGVCRPGDWVGIRIAFTDAAPKPRELILQLSLPDADGDAWTMQREVAANPGVRQGVWMYRRLPAGFRPNDGLTLSAFEATEGAGTAAARQGRLLARARITTRLVVSPAAGLAGVIGNRSYGLSRLSTRLSNEEYAPLGHEVVRVEAGLIPAEMPDRWMGLYPFEFLVWGTGEPSELQADRAAAIREWVERGGHLIIVMPAIGETWTNAASNPLHGLLPMVSVRRREGVDLNAYAPLLADRDLGPLPKEAVVHEFVPDADANPGEAVRVLNGPDGACVAARRLLGTGMVTLIGLDLNQRVFADADRLDPGVFWNRVLGRRGLAPTQADVDKRNDPNVGGGLPTRTAVRLDADLAGQIAKSQRATSGVLLGFVVFALYWLLAGPGGYAILKRRGMIRHAWLGYVATAGLFTAIAWGGANLIRPRRVDGTHLTILDHVYGQPTERARTWMALLVPWYGWASLRVGDTGDGAKSERADLAAPWEPPSEDAGSSGAFPDVRPYIVDARAPGAVTFPTRSTVKQVQIDWAGGPMWKMPFPVPSEGQTGAGVLRLRPNRSGDDSWVIGQLRHDLPGALRDVVVIVVPPQRDLGRGLLSTRTVADARAFALRDPWEPGGTLDLETVTAEGRGRGDTTLATYLRDAISRFAGGTRPFEPVQKIDVKTAADRLLLSGLLSQCEPVPPSSRSNEGYPLAMRYSTHGMDLGRWMSQPCVIVIGQLGGADDAAACPVPMTLDDKAFKTGGKTLVRWVYPLPDRPPEFAKGEPEEQFPTGKK